MKSEQGERGRRGRAAGTGGWRRVIPALVVALLTGCGNGQERVSRPVAETRPYRPMAPALSDSEREAREEAARELAQQGVRLREPLTGVDFLLPGGKLGIGYGELGLPISAFEKLYLEDALGLMPVTGIDDLVGYVHIDSEAKALAYVRLFTSPALVKAFHLPVWLEVVPVGQVDEAYVFGRKGWVDQLERLVNADLTEREYGVVREDEWHRYGLPTPAVEKQGDGFVVTRCLVEIVEPSAWGTGMVQQVEERVSADGRIIWRVLERRKVQGLLVSLSPEE